MNFQYLKQTPQDFLFTSLFKNDGIAEKVRDCHLYDVSMFLKCSRGGRMDTGLPLLSAALLNIELKKQMRQKHIAKLTCLMEHLKAKVYCTFQNMIQN